MNFLLIIFILFLIPFLSAVEVVKDHQENHHHQHQHTSHRLSSNPLLLKDFRPSQQISGPPINNFSPRVDYQENSQSQNQYSHRAVDNYNSGNNLNIHPVSQRSTLLNGNLEGQEEEPKTESSLVQGRIFGSDGPFGGGGGEFIGGNRGISSSWTGLGGGGGYQQNQCQYLKSYNPGCCNLGYTNCCAGGGGGGVHFPPAIGGTGWKGKGYQGGYPYQHQHRPLRPLPQSIIHIRPQQYPHFGGHEKPGSCYYRRPPLSFLSKLNIFNKNKGHDSHQGHFLKSGGGGGGGWKYSYQPTVSQNAGWHFYRRSDRLFKRQLDLSSDKQQGDYNTYQNNNNNYNLQDVNERGDRGFSPDYNNENKYENSYPSVHYGSPPLNVGIGSLTGRIFGGLGWNSGITTGWTSTDPTAPCYTDFECPGNRKCCSGVCKVPSYTR